VEELWTGRGYEVEIVGHRFGWKGIQLETAFGEKTLYEYLELLEKSRRWMKYRYWGRYGYHSRCRMPTLAEYIQIRSFS